MNAADNQLESDLTWPDDGVTRVPYRLFTDPAIYQREQEAIFRGSTWNYAALEVELPEPGDYVTTYIGDTPVVVSRDQQGD
ncbi:MAG: hypothetical protein KUG52_07935, partial [Immundisolibacteraceae bacterium]|nr:hypothetical protein [Immundisolibacteraceae bacterium]